MKKRSLFALGVAMAMFAAPVVGLLEVRNDYLALPSEEPWIIPASVLL
jgi:hypothetical protein